MAGVDIFRKIIEETHAPTDQEHVPVIVLSVPQQIPDRTEYLLGREKNNPGLAIGHIFLQLEQAGATVAAIPCNTAHAPAIFNIIRQQLERANSRLKVLSMIEETVAHLKKTYDIRAVGVLCTTGTRLTGLYGNALQNAGYVVVKPDEQLQDQVHQAIYHPVYGIKSHSSPVKIKSKRILRAAANILIEQGAEVVIMGCSEIPLAIKDHQLGQVPLIDPNRVLARALINAFYLQDKASREVPSHCK